jgi:hypothetical protein
MSKFTQTSDVNETVEVRLDRSTRGVTHPPFVLVAWRSVHGTVAHSMQVAGAGIDHSITSLQSKGVVFPRKAVPGWQAEVVAYATAGIYSVIEVR